MKQDVITPLIIEVMYVFNMYVADTNLWTIFAVLGGHCYTSYPGQEKIK